MLLVLTSSQARPVAAQEPTTDIDLAVENIFTTLTPQERVGQLFMVSFNGNDITAESEIAGLIQTYRIGGVVVSAKNENFSNISNTPGQVLRLTNALQNLAQTPPLTPTAAISSTPVITPAVESYAPMPLFLAVSQEGDGYPNTQIRNGLTDVPSQMALGATWQPDNAQRIGEIVGQELSLLGVNMLLGPSLDVLDAPRPERGGLLGIRAFGGHPFWVAQMGEAYIRGVHQGSNNRVLTIATHFPGSGSSDREIDKEVPTIIKSLEELRQTELPPFFRVTRLNPEQSSMLEGAADGLMTAHVRYGGLQGNVPISLDAPNLPILLTLKEIAPWREAGGLIVSASLGAPAALETITANQDTFPARRLVQDAFLAGSDILQLTDFSFATTPEDQFSNISDAIRFFQEKYGSDSSFQAKVDKAVRKIIKAKIKIYGSDLLAVEAGNPADNLQQLAQISVDIDQIAQEGVTLITPITREGFNPLPRPPQSNETILVFTDSRLRKDCLDCPEFPLIRTAALEESILQLFGPQATRQITLEQISSLSFTDLKVALGDETLESNVSPTEVEARIQAADWIIFAMLDINPEVAPQSDAVRLLLRNRYDAIRNKTLVLFSFNAPYFLDETEISQLTAYYGFYSKGENYLRIAARLLFQQFEPTGASPVGIPAVGRLDLSPDPNQNIQLEPMQWVDTNGNITPISSEGDPITTFDLKQGESILFRTTVIVDRNGHPVPNGTSVNFLRIYPLEGLPLEPLTAGTINGVAEIVIVKERDSPLQVRALSDLAAQLVPFNIGPGVVDTPTPTATPTALPTETPTPTDTATPPATDTPVPTVAPEPTATPPLAVSPQNSGRPVNFVDLVYSLLAMVLVGGIAFTLGGDRFSLEERVRPALVAVALGLVGYILFTIVAMMSPKAGFMSTLVAQNGAGHWVAPLISLLFAIGGTLTWYLKPGRIFAAKKREKLLASTDEKTG